MNYVRKTKLQLAEENIALRAELDRLKQSVAVSSNERKGLDGDADSIFGDAATIRDITELKRTEQEIHKLSLVVEQSPVIVLITDKNGSIEYVNPRFTEVTGYTQQEVLGKNPSLLKSGFTPVEEYGRLWFKLHRGEHWTGEFCNRKKNGELFWELSSIFPLKNPQGEITHLVAVKEDITGRKEIEKRLSEYQDHLEHLVEERTDSLTQVNRLLGIEIKKQKKSEAKIQDQLKFLRTLINSISNPIIIKDKLGRLIDCNKAYENYFNLTMKEIMYKTVKDVVPAHLLEKVMTMEKKLLTSPGQQSLELDYVNASGEQRTLLAYESTYLLSDNSIGGTVANMVDITEQKRLQEKIAAALQKEQELNELKSSFISTASHEFRTPLTTILASTDLLEMFGRQWKEEKYLEHIRKIQKAVDYMKELMDDVLILSRSEEGRIQFVPVQVNFKEMCGGLIEDAKAVSQGRHSFKTCWPDITVVIDPKLARHIISNLLSNAVKYSPAGGTISLNAEIKNDMLMVDVCDEGIGIPEQNRGRLFEPFYRGSNTNAIHGTGLGLSIVKRSVDLHGGTITFDSAENKGTVMHVQLPLGTITDSSGSEI